MTAALVAITIAPAIVIGNQILPLIDDSFSPSTLNGVSPVLVGVGIGVIDGSHPSGHVPTSGHASPELPSPGATTGTQPSGHEPSSGHGSPSNVAIGVIVAEGGASTVGVNVGATVTVCVIVAVGATVGTLVTAGSGVSVGADVGVAVGCVVGVAVGASWLGSADHVTT